MTAIDVEAMLAKRIAEADRVLAIIPRQQLFGAQVVDVDAGLAGQAMSLADHELEIFSEERPRVTPRSETTNR